MPNYHTLLYKVIFKRIVIHIYSLEIAQRKSTLLVPCVSFTLQVFLCWSQPPSSLYFWGQPCWVPLPLETSLTWLQLRLPWVGQHRPSIQRRNWKSKEQANSLFSLMVKVGVNGLDFFFLILKLSFLTRCLLIITLNFSWID